MYQGGLDREQSVMNLPIGTVGWMDLTVDNAPTVRDFYARVAGWTHDDVAMGGYSDYVMKAGEQGVAGICHARGKNSGLPASWLMYIVVADLARALDEVLANGGTVIRPQTSLGGGATYAVITDPAGAACALYQNG